MTITDQEREWLLKVLSKKVKLAKDPKNKKREPKLCQILELLHKKVLAGGDKFNRNELRVLQELLERHEASAVNKVIPELHRRVAKASDKKPYYERVLKETTGRLAMIKELQAKVEEAL